MGIDIKRNPKNIMFTNPVVYNYAFLISKFNLMLKIPTTTKKDVLETAIKLLNKLPRKRLMEFECVIKVINDLSSPLDFISVPFEDNIGSLDYFIEPCLDRVGRLRLEKIGNCFIFVECGRYSLPFIFLDKPCICKQFYRDADGLLTFVIQTRESICALKLKNEPEFL